jgi:hypothetical protein
MKLETAEKLNVLNPKLKYHLKFQRTNKNVEHDTVFSDH